MTLIPPFISTKSGIYKLSAHKIINIFELAYFNRIRLSGYSENLSLDAGKTSIKTSIKIKDLAKHSVDQMSLDSLHLLNRVHLDWR